jgi:glucose/arabinose dehydrogenase
VNVRKGNRAVVIFVLAFVFVVILRAENQNFHNAPASAKTLKNPFASQKDAIVQGRRLYLQRCASCHGKNGEGSGNIPALVDGNIESVAPGELFWFVTHGDPKNGMPAWFQLPENQRWRIVSYVKSLGLSQTESTAAATSPSTDNTTPIKAPPPSPPFTDFRFEQPGNIHKITVKDLPPPMATKSFDNGPDIVSRPANVWPKAPSGFKVELYTSGLNEPRLIRTAPNGDIFLAETRAGRIRVFRGMTSDGKPEQTQIFATGLKHPYGIAFYPLGPNPQYVYVGEPAAVVRFPYDAGSAKASGAAEHIADLPDGSGHTTRDIQFSADGRKMYVGVGSRSNVDDDPDEKNRADILEFNPDGSGMRVYASGIRNPGGGLAIQPGTGQLWCSVNERDALGDNLVPDYITHVQDGGFYGWPWWYIGGHQDPRHQGAHPELKDKVIVPDVLLQAHNASLQLTFYQGKQFPAEYAGDIFAAQHGSWNRSVRAGYEIIRVPLHHAGKATGEYEDFLTGFVLNNGQVWGRPVGVTVAPDGSLLVTDDGSNSIWRVSYTGK